jgi:hypothetical protein
MTEGKESAVEKWKNVHHSNAHRVLADRQEEQND